MTVRVTVAFALNGFLFASLVARVPDLRADLGLDNAGLGLVVLTFAVGEGSANDWIALALVDGYDAAAWVGVAGYSAFVTAMTLGRVLGPWLLDEWGRVRCLWESAGLVAGGVLLVVHGGTWPWVALGCLAWGLGAALGFPVGMSAAADDSTRSAAR